MYIYQAELLEDKKWKYLGKFLENDPVFLELIEKYYPGSLRIYRKLIGN